MAAVIFFFFFFKNCEQHVACPVRLYLCLSSALLLRHYDVEFSWTIRSQKLQVLAPVRFDSMFAAGCVDRAALGGVLSEEDA